MFLKKYLNYLLFVVNLLISFSLFGYLYYLDDSKVPEEKIVTINTDEDKISSDINVEIKGAIVSPGVYKLESSNIINDVIKLAGGFKKDAYTTNINLSKHLEDEMVIYVYTKNEYNEIQKKNKILEENRICQKEVINMCIENGESIIISGDDISVVNKEDLVNINTASKEELTSLNGIGDAKAQSIIEYRNNNGLFQVPEDILKVSGISQTIYDKIKNYITV